MTETSPPTLDPMGVSRFKQQQIKMGTAWLHTEVAKRMAQRLSLFKTKPSVWVDWEPLNGSSEVHKALQQQLPNALVWVIEYSAQSLRALKAQLDSAPARRVLERIKAFSVQRPLSWRLSQQKPRTALRSELGKTPIQTDFIWANMLLHLEPNPQTLLEQWYAQLRVGGWVMFSCLGPDTTHEIRSIYERMGWGAHAHTFTDMHDWGDMLVQTGFSDPVMDMERITLTYSSVKTLLADLRSVGKNFHTQRFPRLRGRAWLGALCDQLQQLSSKHQVVSTNTPSTDALTIPLTFEIIYGHAFKVAPKLTVQSTTQFSAEQMREMLRRSAR